MQLKISELDHDEFLRDIRHGKNFSFSRWNDGEWSSVFGGEGFNCDGHKYFPDMRESLSRVWVECC